MNRVYIEFIPGEGLMFYKEYYEDKIKLHEVNIDTLVQMSLNDLHYCIATNTFIELKDMHEIFREYLWTEDGETKPRKQKDEPR